MHVVQALGLDGTPLSPTQPRHTADASIGDGDTVKMARTTTVCPRGDVSTKSRLDVVGKGAMGVPKYQPSDKYLHTDAYCEHIKCGGHESGDGRATVVPLSITGDDHDTVHGESRRQDDDAASGVVFMVYARRL